VSTREETTGMSLKKRPQNTGRRVLPRAASVALALGGLTSSILVAGSAGGATSKAKSLVISTTTNPKYGTILVSGTTLYTLMTATKTPCGVKCLKVWPRVLLPKGVKQAKAGSGVDATKLGTVKRRGGAFQVTYAGKALYWFYEDSRPNQVKGDVKDKWGTWSVVTMTAANGSLQPAAGTTTVPTTAPTSRTSPTNGTAPTTGRTTPIQTGGTMPTSPPATPTTAPPPPTTTVPTTTPTTSPPTTTTTSGGGGGIGF
jgi:predicted lipoprotein with Yx(FWY)xxD motif